MSDLYNILTESKNPTNVIQYSTQYNIRNQQGSVIRLNNGNLLCAWTYFFEEEEDPSESEIWAKISTNNGLSWGNAYQIIAIEVGTNGVRHPSLFLKSNGDILLVCTLEADDGLSAQVVQYISSDNGATFGGKTSIYSSSDYEAPDCIVSASHRILETTTGRLIYPFHIPTTATHASATGIMVVRFIYSDNQGVSWSISASILGIANPVDEQLLAEPCITQLPNGNLLCLMRTRSGYGRISTSTDNGATWSNPPTKSGTLIESNASVWISYTNNKLIAIVNRPEGGVVNGAAARIRMDLWQSEDNGATWSFIKNLLYKDDDYNFCEPIVYDKGTGILMFYSYYPYGTSYQDLRFERYNYSEL